MTYLFHNERHMLAQFGFLVGNELTSSSFGTHTASDRTL